MSAECELSRSVRFPSGLPSRQPGYSRRAFPPNPRAAGRQLNLGERGRGQLGQGGI